MRVLLRKLPAMLREVLAQALASHPGVEIVDEPPLPPLAEPSSPDVVIVATEDPDANGAPALLRRWPQSRVLMISASGDRSSLVELQPHRTSFGEMSLAQLVSVVTHVTERKE
jgi:DNA-binding NarL/FixJ family response regulator